MGWIPPPTWPGAWPADLRPQLCGDGSLAKWGEKVLEAVKSTAYSSAPGPDGLRASHLRQLLVVRTTGHQIATALAATHAKRITHRDLKPDNVMIVPDPEVGGGERVKVLDFGIAKLAGEPGPGAAGVRTRTGTIMGTPTYMAPEQCRGNAVIEEHADVYALGVMLFEMVAGQPPFQSDAFGELVAMHLFTPPPSLRTFASDAPTELVELVERMLAKAALERPSMDEVAQRLEQLAARPNAGFGAIEAHQLPSNPLALAPTTMRYATSQPSTPARRRWPLALAALLGTSGAAGGLLLWRTQAPSAVAPLRQQDPIPATTSSARAPSPIVEALRGQTAPAPRAASALAAEEASRLHRTCVESTNAGRYKAAVTACQAALRHTPQSSEVRALLRRAETALVQCGCRRGVCCRRCGSLRSHAAAMRPASSRRTCVTPAKRPAG